MPLPTLQQRTQTLQRMERDMPRLLSFYAFSSFSYSVTGLFYLCCLPHLPMGFRHTHIFSGATFGWLLTLQGLVSYCNDGLLTLGYALWPAKVFWLICDRTLAFTLMMTTYGIVATWPSAGPGDPRNTISSLLALTCSVAFPSSRFCECARPPPLFPRAPATSRHAHPRSDPPRRQPGGTGKLVAILRGLARRGPDPVRQDHRPDDELHRVALHLALRPEYPRHPVDWYEHRLRPMRPVARTAGETGRPPPARPVFIYYAR